jgi:hypothetical protein
LRIANFRCIHQSNDIFDVCHSFLCEETLGNLSDDARILGGIGATIGNSQWTLCRFHAALCLLRLLVSPTVNKGAVGLNYWCMPCAPACATLTILILLVS